MSADQIALSCDEVEELAGLYVLGALDPVDEELVRDHLATCEQAHTVFAELAPVVPGLLATIEPIDPPEILRASVLAAIAATPQLPAERRHLPATSVVPVSQPASIVAASTSTRTAPAAPISLDAERARRRGWRDWVRPALAAAAVIAIVALGATAFVELRRASDAEARAAALRAAITASLQPDATVARLEGTGSASGATGIAAFPQGQPGTIVMRGLQPLGSDQTYESWLIASGTAYPAGLMSVGDDGLAIQQGVELVQGADTVALTVEQAGGAQQPTSAPIVVGQMQSGPIGLAETSTTARPAAGLATVGYFAAGAASLALVIVPGPRLRADASARLAAPNRSTPLDPSVADDAIPTHRLVPPRS